ncbi:MAG: thioredoxin family protein [Thaumarchaeota archaeon]|nr:thioredoxin family protein [Nitrososphaerota archaeon]
MVLLTSNDAVLKSGMKAPQFLNLPSVDGKKYSLSSFAGKKALLIIFMCNHCPYVRPKMPKMVELQSRYGDIGFQLVGINPNDPAKYPDDNFDGMQKAAGEQQFNFPYLVDDGGTIAKKYGAVCTPDPYLFNEKMELVYHGRFDDAHGKPGDEATTNELEEAIKQVLSGNNLTVKQFPSMGCSIKWK